MCVCLCCYHQRHLFSNFICDAYILNCLSRGAWVYSAKRTTSIIFITRQQSVIIYIIKILEMKWTRFNLSLLIMLLYTKTNYRAWFGKWLTLCSLRDDIVWVFFSLFALKIFTVLSPPPRVKEKCMSCRANVKAKPLKDRKGPFDDKKWYIVTTKSEQRHHKQPRWWRRWLFRLY